MPMMMIAAIYHKIVKITKNREFLEMDFSGVSVGVGIWSTDWVNIFC